MYYRNEYTEKQWKALVDRAAELGCQVTYGRYGDRAEIDSTALEDSLTQNFPNSIGTARQEWAENIHRMLQESSRACTGAPREDFLLRLCLPE